MTWIRSALVPYLKRHLVLCRAITNNDYSKLREEQFPQKELNVAVALILGQNKIFHPISYKITNMRVPYIFSVSGLHVGFLLLF
jgi:hypothetical protein